MGFHRPSIPQHSPCRAVFPAGFSDPKGQNLTSGCALLCAEPGSNTCSLRGWWVESRGKRVVSHPHSPLPWPAPAPPHPAPLQLWKLVPQPRKVNLLEVSCLAARTSQSGAGGTSPTSKDKGLGAGPEGLEGGPCLKACAPETEKGSRRERGREEEVGSRKWKRTGH